MNRKLLVLDNDPPRHRIFREAVGEFQILNSYYVHTFEQSLRVDEPTVISLDHDLEGGVNAGRECEECGCDAAEIIARSGPPDVPVLIHSGNDHCAHVMRRILVASGRRGRVSRVNIDSMMKQGERSGIEMMREAILELLASPHWPADVSTEELLDMLGCDRRLVCPVKSAPRKG